METLKYHQSVLHAKKQQLSTRTCPGARQRVTSHSGTCLYFILLFVVFRGGGGGTEVHSLVCSALSEQEVAGSISDSHCRSNYIS